MKRLKYLLGLALSLSLMACGGGGGSPGTVAGGSGNSGTATLSASIIVGMRSAAGGATNSVPQAGVTATATVKDSLGAPVAGKLVTFSADSTLIRFSPSTGQVLTDGSGVASISVIPASLTTVGAGTMNATSIVGSQTVAGSFDFQVPSSGSVTATGSPSLIVELKTLAGASTNAVSGAGVSAVATVRDSVGLPVIGKLVTFNGDAALIKFSPASGKVLTDSNGVATVQVSPASISAGGAGTLDVSTNVADVVLTKSFDYQLSASNVTLSSLDVGTGTMAAFANRGISVIANINGSPATNTPIQVTFQASCGVVNPATVTTDNAGKAATTYSANSINCAGSNVSISASAPGAPVLQASIAVQNSQATNVEFVSATPALIYLKDSVGPTQSQIVFRVVDAVGTPLQNQSLQLSLITSGSTGVAFGTVGNTSPVTLSTDASGRVSLPVFSGTVPTSAQVRAVLTTNAAVAATSNVLTVASGRAVQKSASASATKLAIEGFNFDGSTTDISFSVADRQGNPVPDGTQVNFTSEAGVLIPPTCSIAGGTSKCTVQLRSQGTRPANGIVSVLAYVPGEEDFVDANFNNVYDTGETFTDLGNAYRDDNDSGGFDTGEFSVPRAGTTACSGGVNGRANTCDGAWGVTDVRIQRNIIFSTSIASIVGTLTNTQVVGTATAGSIDLTIADTNGNSMPTGSVIALDISSAQATGCGAKLVATVIPNQLSAFNTVITLDKCRNGDSITVKVTTPLGTTTARTFNVTSPP